MPLKQVVITRHIVKQIIKINTVVFIVHIPVKGLAFLASIHASVVLDYPLPVVGTFTALVVRLEPHLVVGAPVRTDITVDNVLP